MTKQTGSADPARGHVVLASADSDAFTSLRRRPASRRDRYQMGRDLRRQVPRSSLGEWSADRGRPDPVQLIIKSHDGRLDWLIPVRVGRMTATPYGFLRGAAVVMAADAARLPSTGITPVICGDAHLGNMIATPTGPVLCDLDTACIGPREWDLVPLAVSLEDPDGFTLFMQEVAANLRQKAALAKRDFSLGKIVLSGHSGGYQVISSIVAVGGLSDHVKEVWPFDAL